MFLKRIVYCAIVLSFVACVICGLAMNNKEFSTFKSDTKEENSYEQVVSYVSAYSGVIEDRIDEINEIGKLYKAVYVHSEEPGIIKGRKKNDLYVETIIKNPLLSELFSDERLLSIYFEKDGIIVFNTGGKGISIDSKNFGFYYTPNGIPLWIDADMLEPLNARTGKYLYYPMIQNEDGWIANKDALTINDDNNNLLDSYSVYTKKIFDEFYYYESSYS